jgi:AraC-like DNA-binding protein
MDGEIEFDFRTRDTDAAMEHLRQSYGRLSIQGPVDYGVATVGDRRFSLGSVHLGGELSVSGVVDGFTVVAGPDRYQWQVGDERGDLDRSPILFHPHVPLQVHVDRVQVSAVRFDSRELERLARRAYDNPDLHLGFDGPRPVSAELGARWVPLVRSISLQREEILHNELLRADAYRQLAVAALSIFRFEFSTPRRAVTSRGAAVAYRAAVAFIEENAARPITVEDVAAVAGVSSMRLGQIFSHHASPSESPRACIRRVRLAAAQREMARSAPEEMTLADVAARWGFTQQGLVRHYRRAFGVDPRVDLPKRAQTRAGSTNR